MSLPVQSTPDEASISISVLVATVESDQRVRLTVQDRNWTNEFHSASWMMRYLRRNLGSRATRSVQKGLENNKPFSFQINLEQAAILGIPVRRSQRHAEGGSALVFRTWQLRHKLWRFVRSRRKSGLTVTGTM